MLRQGELRCIDASNALDVNDRRSKSTSTVSYNIYMEVSLNEFSLAFSPQGVQTAVRHP